MLNVSIKLDRMHCNAESDAGASEPYMWTVFFHADINSITVPNHRLVTYTPHSNWTTRGLYPDGVRSGDDVSIPEAMGDYNITLDDGGLDGVLLAGVMFILLEQDYTDSDALIAGHEAFAESCHAVLNSYVESKVMADEKTPTDDEIQMMADEIQGEVEDAIRDKLSWYDALDNQDDFLGFGYRFLTHDRLNALASQANRTESFSALINHEDTDEFEVFGTVRAISLDPPTSPFSVEQYTKAVQALDDIDDEIDKTKEQLQETSGAKRKALLAELQHKRRIVRPLAVKALVATRAEYEVRRNSICIDQADSLESKERLAREKRFFQGQESMFRNKANVAVMQIGGPLAVEDCAKVESVD